MDYYWRAIVRMSGVPTVTEEEMVAVSAVIPGSVKHEKGRAGGRLLLDWRFSLPSRQAWQAIKQVNDRRMLAINQIASAVDPLCEDFRVLRVKEL
jgi:hypothetical protein